jgi:hypothetical protein
VCCRLVYYWLCCVCSVTVLVWHCVIRHSKGKANIAFKHSHSNSHSLTQTIYTIIQTDGYTLRPTPHQMPPFLPSCRPSRDRAGYRERSAARRRPRAHLAVLAPPAPPPPPPPRRCTAPLSATLQEPVLEPREPLGGSEGQAGAGSPCPSAPALCWLALGSGAGARRNEMCECVTV